MQNLEQEVQDENNNKTDSTRAESQKTEELQQKIQQVRTFADAFLVIGACLVLAALMVPLMKKVAPPAAPSPDAH